MFAQLQAVLSIGFRKLSEIGACAGNPGTHFSSRQLKHDKTKQKQPVVSTVVDVNQ